MSSATLFRWTGIALEPLDYCSPGEVSIEAADSWLVADGSALALELHRARFADSVRARGHGDLQVDALWRAVIDAIPRTGAWFPRVELTREGGGFHFRYRHRQAPELARS